MLTHTKFPLPKLKGTCRLTVLFVAGVVGFWSSTYGKAEAQDPNATGATFASPESSTASAVNEPTESGSSSITTAAGTASTTTSTTDASQSPNSSLHNSSPSSPPTASNVPQRQTGSAIITQPTAAGPSPSVQTGQATVTTPSIESSALGTTAPPPGNSPSSSPTSSTATLKGVATTGVSATVRSLPVCPLPRMRDRELKFVEVVLKNDSGQVALVNGDSAQAQVEGKLVPAVGSSYIVHEGRPGLNWPGVLAVLAASGGSLGLAGPIFYEKMTPLEHGKRSLGTSIGIDGARHQTEAERFGLRVLMPGDQTVGWMSFSCSPPKTITSVTIPVSFSRSLTPDATLVVPVANQ